MQLSKMNHFAPPIKDGWLPRRRPCLMSWGRISEIVVGCLGLKPSKLETQMTHHNKEINQYFLPLLPAQVEVLKRVQMIDNNKHDRRIVTHRMHPKFAKRRKPTHIVVRNGQQVEVT